MMINKFFIKQNGLKRLGYVETKMTTNMDFVTSIKISEDGNMSLSKYRKKWVDQETVMNDLFGTKDGYFEGMTLEIDDNSFFRIIFKENAGKAKLNKLFPRVRGTINVVKHKCANPAAEIGDPDEYHTPIDFDVDDVKLLTSLLEKNR